MEGAGNPSPHVVVLPDAFHLRSVDEVARADCLPHNIVVVLASGDLKSQLLGNIHQLRTDFPDLP